MKYFPDHANKTEAKIINKIITSALKNGYSISVFDGEDYSLLRSTTRKEIKAECFATDETTLIFHKGEYPDNKGWVVVSDYKGWVWLIHGNSYDVISDYSDNPEIEEILKPAMQYAEELS